MGRVQSSMPFAGALPTEARRHVPATSRKIDRLPPGLYNGRMLSTTIAAALSGAVRRNEALAAAYRSASRRLLSRQVATMSASASEQRRELALALSEMVRNLDAETGELMVALPEERLLAGPDPAGSTSVEASALLAFFRDEESLDRELYTTLARAPGLAGDVAARFGAFAEQARKRASVASDHLDLLSLG